MQQLVQDLVLNSYELVVAKLRKVERQRIELLRSATLESIKIFFKAICSALFQHNI